MKRIVNMFSNPDVSVDEEIKQAKEWKDAQRKSELRARQLILAWMAESRPKSRKNEVTPEIILRAKEYPIENMIDVKKGVARCISGEHEDKKPSMRVKNNRATCFSCGYKDDAIGVAQKLYGISFHDAVMRLQ